MKKIISAILAVSMVLGMSTATFARPEYRREGQRYQEPYKGRAGQADIRKKNDNAAEKKARFAAGYTARRKGSKASDTPEAPDAAQKADKPQWNDGKADTKADTKFRTGLLNRCSDLASQVSRLKGYIVSEDGKFLTKFKDRETGNDALRSIKDAAAKLEEYREHINTAASNKELNTIKDDLQKNFMKHQAIVKRVTGLTSAARLKEAYDRTKALVDKLGAGINGITAGAGVSLDIAALKKKYAKIEKRLKAAYNNYLEANAAFSAIGEDGEDPAGDKADPTGDKAFKAAHSKLMEAKGGLHDVLVESRRLLDEIKTGAHS